MLTDLDRAVDRFDRALRFGDSAIADVVGHTTTVGCDRPVRNLGIGVKRVES